MSIYTLIYKCWTALSPTQSLKKYKNKNKTFSPHLIVINFNIKIRELAKLTVLLLE